MILSIIFIRFFYKTNKKIFAFITGITLIQLITYSKWNVWEGGLTLGARFMLPVVPLLCIFLKDGISILNKKSIVIKLCILSLLTFGFFIQLIALSIDYQAIGVYYHYLNKQYFVYPIRYHPFSKERIKINKYIFNIGLTNLIKYSYYMAYEPPLENKVVYSEKNGMVLNMWIHLPNYTPVYYAIVTKIKWQILKKIYLSFLLLAALNLFLIFFKCS